MFLFVHANCAQSFKVLGESFKDYSWIQDFEDYFPLFSYLFSVCL